MKIIVVGAHGTIGSAVVKELSSRHQLIKVGRSSGDFQCDIKDPKSIHVLFKAIGPFDALISCAGNVHFAPLAEMNYENYQVGLHDKLMGQVNLVLIGREYINEKSSFTLTSGILSNDPILAGSSASMVNGAIDSWVKAVAIELPKNLRINAVSPTIVEESLEEFGPYFRGFEAVPANRVALAYSKSVEGHQTGQIYKVE